MPTWSAAPRSRPHSRGASSVDPTLVAELRRHGERLADLIGPVEDDPRGGWRFHEDGAASLVWLKSFLPA